MDLARILFYLFSLVSLVHSTTKRSVTVEVIKYVHGDRWVGIVWDYIYEFSDPGIEYRLASGTDDEYKLIDRPSVNTGSYPWSVPQELSEGTYVIRIVHHNTKDLPGPLIEESAPFSLPDSLPRLAAQAPDDHDYSKILYVILAALGASVLCYALRWYRQAEHQSPNAPGVYDSEVSYQGMSATDREEHFRDRLIEFYSTHSPNKLNQLDRICRRYRGKEEQLFQKLHQKYTTNQDKSPEDIGEKESDRLLTDI